MYKQRETPHVIANPWDSLSCGAFLRFTRINSLVDSYGGSKWNRFPQASPRKKDSLRVPRCN